MSTELKRWFEGTMVGLAIVAVGCGGDKPGDENADETDTTGEDPTGDPTGEVPDNGIPLELELAAFNKTGQFLLLRFSEPVGPVDGVDPHDFRVSFALTMRYAYYGYIYQSSQYADPNYALFDTYYYGYYPLEPDLIVNGKMATDIVLRFANPMTAQGCASFEEIKAAYEDLNDLPQYEVMVGLFPHYSPGAIPIKSLDGEALAAIGPEWVEWPAPYMDLYGEFGWPNLDPQVEIPCTVEPEP